MKGEAMAGPRDYSVGTEMALATLSRGTCYYPGCEERIVKFFDGEPCFMLQRAHIYPAGENGPRHVEGMAAAELSAFANLILLCKYHHDKVDKKERHKYPPELLQQWKSDREGDGRAVLAGLTGVTEERLEALFTQSIAAERERLEELIIRLEQQADSDSVRLLVSITDELMQWRESRGAVEYEAALSLADAGRQLAHLPDTAPDIRTAAELLAGLEGMINQLAALDPQALLVAAEALQAAAMSMREARAFGM